MRLKLVLGFLIIIGIQSANVAAARKYCKKIVPRLVTVTNNGTTTREYVKKEVTVCCKGYRKFGTKCVPACNRFCENGKCTKPNVCTCNWGYKKLNDFRCVPKCDNCKSGYCSAPNVCTCFKGYEKSAINGSCLPTCTNPCINGYCSQPEFCTCNDGYKISNKDIYTCILNQTLTTTEEIPSSTADPVTEILELEHIPVNFTETSIRPSSNKLPNFTEIYPSTEIPISSEILSSSKLPSATETQNFIDRTSSQIVPNPTEIPSSTEISYSTEILSSSSSTRSEMLSTTKLPSFDEISSTTVLPTSVEIYARTNSVLNFTEIPSSTEILRSSSRPSISMMSEMPSSTKLPRFDEIPSTTELPRIPSSSELSSYTESTEAPNKQFRTISTEQDTSPEHATNPSVSTELLSDSTLSQLKTDRPAIISFNTESNTIENCDHDCQFGRCIQGICQCNKGYRFDVDSKKCISSCRLSCINGVCNDFDLCECFEGYEKRNQTYCSPVCDPRCVNGECVQPDFCQCYEGFMKSDDEFVCIENFVENKKEYVLRKPGDKLTSMAGLLSLYVICAVILIFCVILIHFFVMRKFSGKAYNIDKLERNKGSVKFTAENDVITA